MADQENFPNIYIDESVAPGGVGSLADPYSDFSEINWTTGGDNSIFDYYAGVPTAKVIIYLKRGEVWQETLTVGADGSAAYPITIDDYGSGADPIINGANLVTTWTEADEEVWDAYVMNTDTGAPADSNIRCPVPAATFTQNGSKIQVDFEAHTTQNCILSDVFIGEKAAAGDVYDMEPGTITRITWDGGGTGTTINAGTTKTSDWITYAFDSSKDYILSIGATDYARLKTSSPTCYYKVDASGDAGTANVAGYTPATNYYFLTEMRIETDAVNLWRATLTTEPYQVFFDGTKGNVQTAIEDVDSENDWYWEADVLYVYSTGDPDDDYTDPGIEASVRSNCILSDNKDYITYTDLHVKYANNRNVRLQGGTTYNDIDGVEVEYAYLDGIFIDGAATGYNTVQNSDVHHNGRTLGENIGCGIMITSESSNNILTYNDCYSNAEDGIAVGGDETVSEASVGGINNTISYNNLYSNLEDGIDLKQGPQIVEYNDVYDNAYNGIWIHNFAEDVIIRYNKFRDNNSHAVRIGGDAYAEASSHDAHRMYYNLVYNNSGSAFLAGGGGGVHDLDSMFVCNNVFYHNSGDNGDFRYIGDALTLKNNIFVTNDAAFCVQIERYTSMSIDYNSYDNSIDNAFYDKDRITLYTKSEIADGTLFAATGWEQHGIVGDPLFVDPAIGNFHLGVGSLCIDAGVGVGLTEDFDGNPV